MVYPLFRLNTDTDIVIPNTDIADMDMDTDLDMDIIHTTKQARKNKTF